LITAPALPSRRSNVSSCGRPSMLTRSPLLRSFAAVSAAEPNSEQGDVVELRFGGHPLAVPAQPFMAGHPKAGPTFSGESPTPKSGSATRFPSMLIRAVMIRCPFTWGELRSPVTCCTDPGSYSSRPLPEPGPAPDSRRLRAGRPGLQRCRDAAVVGLLGERRRPVRCPAQRRRVGDLPPIPVGRDLWRLSAPRLRRAFGQRRGVDEPCCAGRYGRERLHGNRSQDDADDLDGGRGEAGCQPRHVRQLQGPTQIAPATAAVQPSRHRAWKFATRPPPRPSHLRRG